MEMLEQHALLLQGKNEQLQHDLSRARKNIEKLVVITLGQAEQVAQLNGRVKQLTRDLSSAYVEITDLKNQQLAGRSSTPGGTAFGLVVSAERIHRLPHQRLTSGDLFVQVIHDSAPC
ncbi:hypothetical protein [Pseudomonas alkylphenolica]|uniref:hypothetical protein n=1 Tax=Pseudomonas alkylphenolica TaxID=237609 RepID=UPI00315C8E94